MNLVRPTYDIVNVDEAQDMNALQLMIARGACKVTGRVIIVGDSRQAIYGFRGAVQDGMDVMKESLQADTLSLTTTYRCPQAVVSEAAKLVPAYKAAPEAPAGSVTPIGSVESAQIGDAILSRLNAPLMPLALGFLRKGISARIEGRDIGKQLIGMIKGFKSATIEELLVKIQAWEKKQIARLQDSKNSEKKIEVVQDTADTLQAICADCQTVADAEQKLAGLFQDTDEKSRPAIVLSSVHKAKGLEWPRVFLLQETFRASRGGEEANILYVALTRAMRELFLVSPGNGSVTNGNSGKKLPSKPAVQEPAQAVEAKIPLPAQESRPETVQDAIPQPLRKGPPARKPIDSNKVHVQPAIFDNLDTTPGMRLRVPGEVVCIGEKSYVVEKVNGSGAICRNLRNASDTEHISRSAGTEVPIVMEQDFQIAKPERKGKQQHNQGEEKNSMKESTPIELFITKAIGLKKTDAQIIVACSQPKSFPDVPADEVVKTIGRLRKAAEKAASKPAVPPARKEKGAVNSGNNSQAGSADYVRKLYADGLTKTAARAKCIGKYPSFEHGIHFEYRWNSAERAAAKAKEKAKAAEKAATKPAKVTKTAVVTKAPPVRKPKTPAATEPDQGVPAQGEEVPAE
jgi:hypothetical protein